MDKLAETDLEQWDLIIKPKAGFLNLQLAEIWRYRDLIYMFVKRDVVTVYKQTILGPVWFIVQPLLTTLMFVLVFGRIAKLSTDGLPQILFYLSGIVVWNYFSELSIPPQKLLLTMPIFLVKSIFQG